MTEEFENLGLAKVEVSTLAKPDPTTLVSVRCELQRNSKVFHKFYTARNEGWTQERLVAEVVPELRNVLEDGEEQLTEAVKYLADEYEQTGDARLIIDTSTGQAIVALREEDYYTPPPVLRESGNVVKRGKQIRPSIVAMLFQWKADTEREKRVVAELEVRAKEAGLVQPHLEIATREGRKSIVDEVRESLPTIFPRRLSGSAQVFAQRFNVEETDRSDLTWHVAEAVVKIPIADPLAVNLRYAYTPRLLALIGQQWAREIACKVATQAAGLEGVETRMLSASEVTASHLVSSNVWIAPIMEAKILGECALDVLPVAGASSCIGLSGKVGALFIRPDYEIHHREVFDRLEIFARVPYAVGIDNSEAIEVLNLTDVPISGVTIV